MSVFGLIFVAELPDKTALASIVLASRLPPGPVFIGACTAFLCHALLSVTVGTLLGRLPHHAVHVAAAVIFFVLAILMWRRKDEEKDFHLEHQTFWKVASVSCGVIFVAEFGDLTQFAMASMAARYAQPVLVLGASVLALWTVTALGVAAGARLRTLVSPRLLQRVAAVVFVAVGAWLLTAGQG